MGWGEWRWHRALRDGIDLPPILLDHLHLSATSSTWWEFTKVWGMN